MNDALIAQFNGASREWSSYLCRLVIRPQIAAELESNALGKRLELCQR